MCIAHSRFTRYVKYVRDGTLATDTVSDVRYGGWEGASGQSIIYNKNASTRLDELIVCLSGCQNVQTRAFHIALRAGTYTTIICRSLAIRY